VGPGKSQLQTFPGASQAGNAASSSAHTMTDDDVLLIATTTTYFCFIASSEIGGK